MMKTKRTLFCLLACLALAGSPASSKGRSKAAVQPVTVFESGKDGYGSFRIPAIARAADGGLLAFAEWRRNGVSDAGDIDLVCRKSKDGGKTWGDLNVIWDDGGNTCGNPSPVVLGNGRIVLLMTWNLGSDKEGQIERNQSVDTRRVFVTFSDDDGGSWSRPEEITSEVKKSGWGWFATGPCHAIVKTRPPHKGRIVVPSNHSETGADGRPQSRSQLLFSDDCGASWSLGAVTEVSGNESTAAELADGSIYLNMRHTVKGEPFRLYAISRDGGETFSEQGRSTLIEPVCQGSVMNLVKHGKASGILIFSNPSDTSKRRNLLLQKSLDGGRTWESFMTIFKGPAAYSDIVLIGRNHIGVIFENGEGKDPYQRISFSEIP